MRQFGHLLLALAIGLGGGLGSAWYALSQGLRFGRVDIGAWSIWPRGAGVDADPYSRAALVRDGALPLAVGEGASFTARVDDEGRPLDGRCRYAIVGQTPQARAWTLVAHALDGRVLRSAGGRPVLTSSEIVRRADGAFLIAAAAGIEPGNWLPIEADTPFTLTLNLYDSPISGIGGDVSPRLLPRIERRSCR